MKIQTQNFLMYYIKATAYNLLLVLTTGTVIQTFMLECGISEDKVSLYVSAMQIIQTLTMLVLSKRTENVKDIRKAVGLCFLGYIPFFAVMIILCCNFAFTADTKYILIFAVSVIMNLFLGVYSIICYKLPHVIMDMTNYGKALGRSGVIAGIVSMAFSAIMTFVLSKSSYYGTMKALFVFGIVLSVVALISAFMLKKISDGTTENAEKVKMNFFKYKPFYQLIIPNFMRGFSQGIFNLITVIGYSCGLLDLATAAVIATVTQISMLISCQSYSFLVKKVQNGMLILISSVIFCIVSPLMTATTSRSWFYVFYFIAYFFVNYVSYSIPVLVATHIDYKVLSQYTAWRMALYTLGIGAGGAVVPPLLECLGHTGTLIVCGVSLLPCGIGYYLFERKKTLD